MLFSEILKRKAPRLKVLFHLHTFTHYEHFNVCFLTNLLRQMFIRIVSAQSADSRRWDIKPIPEEKKSLYSNWYWWNRQIITSYSWKVRIFSMADLMYNKSKWYLFSWYFSLEINVYSETFRWCFCLLVFTFHHINIPPVPWLIISGWIRGSSTLKITEAHNSKCPTRLLMSFWFGISSIVFIAFSDYFFFNFSLKLQ